MEKIVAMMMWWENVKAAVRNEKGQGMVEYGLILALIAVVLIGALTTMGTNLGSMFNTAASKVAGH